MRAYCAEGEARAMALGNRGPIRFTGAGDLHPEIREAYSRCGFYVFTGVLQADELADIEADFLESSRVCRPIAAPRSTPRAARRSGFGHAGLNLVWAKPLSDPVGGTKAAHGRYPVKMFEPEAAADAPDEVVYLSWARCSSPTPACASTATRSCWRSPRRSTARTSCRSTRRCG